MTGTQLAASVRELILKEDHFIQNKNWRGLLFKQSVMKTNNEFLWEISTSTI